MPTYRLAKVSVVLALLFAGCANYDFTRARTATGEPDFSKLIQDLEASGKPQLDDGIWIPFLYLNLTTFKKSDIGYPAGYSLEHLRAAGPLFCTGGKELRVVDTKGAAIEQQDASWLGWGVLHHGEQGRIETTSGPRLTDSLRVLLLFGKDDTAYATHQAAGEPPTVTQQAAK